MTDFETQFQEALKNVTLPEFKWEATWNEKANRHEYIMSFFKDGRLAMFARVSTKKAKVEDIETFISTLYTAYDEFRWPA